MQEEKSAVYTVILGVCLLLCLLMLGNMLMGRADTGIAPAAPEEGDAMEFHITEDDIASVMTEALPFPFSKRSPVSGMRQIRKQGKGRSSKRKGTHLIRARRGNDV